MRAAGVIPILFLPLLVGCERERQPGPPVPLKTFALHDVQGLFGGQAIWASEDRTAIVQLVGHSPGHPLVRLWEQRYKRKLSVEEWSEGERLVGAHHLITLKLPDRLGEPDEARPDIFVVTGDGKTIHHGKWANDKQPDFDAVYDYLLSLCLAEGELIHEGEYDVNWRPKGFARP